MFCQHCGNKPLTYIIVACIGAMIFGLLTNENFDLDKAAKFFKVDVTAKDSNGDTPLHLAARKGDRERVGYLLTKGADVNAKNLYGSTPLHHAARQGYDEIVKLLVFNGANVNAKNVYGYTPLHNATENNRANIPAFLVSNGADVKAKNENGITPLDYDTNASKNLKNLSGQ